MRAEDTFALESDALVAVAAKTGRRLRVVADQAELYADMAEAMAQEVRLARGEGRPCRLIVPVGPRGQYPLFVEICRRDGLDLSDLHLFAMDEYLDWEGRAVPPSHPLSFRGFLERELVSRLPASSSFQPRHLVLPDPLRLDAYAERIAALGGIDCCFGGVGVHGHVAFNEPHLSRYSRVTPTQFRAGRARVVPLAPETVVMNSIRGNGGDFAAFPAMAVTCGMADILGARRIRLYLDGGPWQRAVLRRALLDPPTVEYPVTLLGDHPDLVFTADRETAAPLAGH